MTFQQQTKTVSENVLHTLSSKDGFLIGYSLNEDGEIKKSQHAIIKELKLLPKEELKALLDSEPIVFVHKISPAYPQCRSLLSFVVLCC